MPTDPGRRIRDPLGFPVWLGLWIALVPMWVQSTLFYANGGYELPRMFGVFGYDGFVNAQYAQLGSRVPKAGGWMGLWPALSVVAVLWVSSCVIGWQQPRRWCALAPALWAPVWMLVMALAAMTRPNWDGVDTGLRHFVFPVHQPVWHEALPFIAGPAAITAMVVLPVVSVEWSTLRWQRVISVVALIAGLSWLVSLDLVLGKHTTQVLSEVVLLWCLTVQLIFSIRRLRQRDRPVWLLRLLTLTRNEQVDIAALYIALFLLGPVLAMFLRLHMGIGSVPAWLGYYVGLFVAVMGTRHSARRLRVVQWQSLDCLQCRYDLRGTVAAGRRACPECGQAVADEQYDWLRQHLDEVSA